MSFAKGRDLIVEIPVNPKGTADIHMDDTTALSVDLEGTDNVLRLEQGSLLGVHVVSRDLYPKEPIQGKHMAAMAKLIAEADETKTI